MESSSRPSTEYVPCLKKQLYQFFVCRIRGPVKVLNDTKSILYESELGFRKNLVSFRTFKGPLFNQKILVEPFYANRHKAWYSEVALKVIKKSKWFFQADVSSKKRTNEFYFTTVKPLVDLLYNIQYYLWLQKFRKWGPSRACVHIYHVI